MSKVVRTNTTVKIREIAFQVYLNRQITGKAGDAISDWSTAQRIYNSPIHRLRFQLNWLLIHADQRASAPLVRWVFNTSTFQVFERLSPVLEAIGVLAIPFLVFAVTQSSQDKTIARERDYQQTLRQQDTERLQQQAVKDYFGQLTTLLLSLEDSLQSPENKRLRLLAEATTLALLDEPEFTRERKEQVIRFLSRMELVNEQTLNETSPSDEKIGAILSLSGANLEDTNLSGMTLRRANLRKASLRKAILYKTNLSKADLSEADLGGAVLAETDLSEANLTNVNFSEDIAVSYDIDDTGTVVTTNMSVFEKTNGGPYLRETDLSGANLSGANLSGAILSSANLSGANLSNVSLYEADLDPIGSLTKEQIESALLCRTNLPKEVGLDANRDCEQFESGF